MDKNIQAMPLVGNATSPHTVESSNDVVEFTTAGDVTITWEDGTTKTATVLEGSRYAIANGTKTITFGGTFSVG